MKNMYLFVSAGCIVIILLTDATIENMFCKQPNLNDKILIISVYNVQIICQIVLTNSNRHVLAHHTISPAILCMFAPIIGSGTENVGSSRESGNILLSMSNVCWKMQFHVCNNHEKSPYFVAFSWKMVVLGKTLMPQRIMELKRTRQTAPSSLKRVLVGLETGKCLLNYSFQGVCQSK